MNIKYTIILVLFSNLFISQSLLAQKNKLDNYNISWSTPGMNSQGSMPIGNGDIGANVWVESNGDLVFYLSKTDAWSENGQLLKLGKVRVSLMPNPYKQGVFSQELRLQQGSIYVNYGEAQIRIWIDANHPVLQVDIESKKPLNAKVSFESWRKTHRELKGREAHAAYAGESSYDESCRKIPVFQEPDTILSKRNNKIIWFHHNSYSCWTGTLDLQALSEAAKINTDPLSDRTFGGLIEAEGFTSVSDTVLVNKNSSGQFQINIFLLTKIGSSQSWEKSLSDNAAAIQKIGTKNRLKAHQNWWQKFWNQNYIFISSKDTVQRRLAEIVNHGYILQRFINACGGRGNSPIKFNGSIFTVDCYNRNDEYKGYDADFRMWGGPYWWQNTRLPYWSMLVSGDFELMKPLFDMYLNCLPLRKAATKKYFGHDGVFFPETMLFWGTHANGDYGCNRNGIADGYTLNPYVRYYWQSGLELSLIMLDYYLFTNDSKFAQETLVPLVSEVLTFYDQHWKRGSDGKILFSPAMSLETFHTAENPLPEIVGIRTVAEKMLALPQSFITESLRQKLKLLINDLPEVPTRIVSNETILAPASEFSNKANVENPELYAVFPYRAYGVGKPDIEMAKRTFALRTHKENGGWQQNSIQAACLGLSNEAKDMVVESFSKWDRNFRFPAFWGPNYDWTPDQDHGNVAMIALQRMLIQYENDKVYLLPAWPKEWDVCFKVNAPDNTTIEGVYENGKMMKLEMLPKGKIQIEIRK
jgi:alpha-L-fucosidase 2